ncbi:hypothetical protein [Arthrobacter sp. AL12]|uniref:hypothetical protein n=1 Tax=Arthrobacter sp. AL12 TaxID=3042241 RepID=UPI00249BC88F|nr:hypothetical protein [Arthrobacter sp. AL12]MDI3213272.1 hypothetical protein [Arthrobacter sp. AL12]
MTTNLIRGKNRKGFVLLAGVIVFLLMTASAIFAVTSASRQQDRDSLLQLKEEQLKTLLDARGKLPPAVNTYIAAYKKAHLAAGSRDKAEQDSKKEHGEFKQAEASARNAMGTLTAGRGVGGGKVSDAIAQYEDSYLGFVDYMTGLVDSYPQYQSLFGEGDASCQGIFVGNKAANLSERETLLTEAAGICRNATEELGQSQNSTYAEYAQRVENRVGLMELDATSTAKAEENLKAFTATKDQLVQKVDEATARKASAEELLGLADEAKSLNKTIKASKSEFDFAAKRYTKTVKEMPSLLEDVFSKHVAGEMKHFDSVIPLRSTVLEAVIDDLLVE